MGLASAMTTALTGMTAAETTIDVVGNNLANANTVGFKASTANFATQFMQTLSLGAQPTETTGGVNPRQIGMGTTVAEISQNFTEGTVQISSSPLDMAIQGDGFFIVQGSTGEQLYTRNGQFKLNSENEMVSLTGQRVLGYGVDEQYEIQRTVLEPITIPLGSAAVAKATENVYLEGTLTPTGDVADVAQRIQSEVLSSSAYRRPEDAPVGMTAPTLSSTGITSASAAGTNIVAGTYEYKFVYADGPYSPDNPLTESVASDPVTVTLLADADHVDLTVPPPPAGLTNNYTHVRAYRRAQGQSDYYFVGDAPRGSTTAGTSALITDNVTEADLTTLDHQKLNTDRVTTETDVQYRYYVTYVDGTGLESRPSPISEPISVSDGRIQLSGLEMPEADDTTAWTTRRIYRSPATSTNDSDLYLAGEMLLDPSVTTWTDSMPDSTLLDPTRSGYRKVNLDGPGINTGTLLVDLIHRSGGTYENVFKEGTLEFTGRKGGRSLQTQELEITDQTKVADLITFMQDALGIQGAPGDDPSHPIPTSTEPEPYGADPGGAVIGSRIVLTANNGVDAAVEIGLSGLQMKTASGTENVSMSFGTLQEAKGESAVTDFLVYDSLGMPLRVRLTAVMESRDSNSTTYRWFADSADNDPLSGDKISVGTGLITFDGEGNMINATNPTIAVQRDNVASASPLQCHLDFTKLSGLAADRSSLSVSRQDGSAPGTLSSFVVGEDGTIKGVFSNGVSRDLGLIRLARFANKAGLEQRGENLYASGVNSGLPIEGDPGTQGLGKVVSGAVELSNTDIGNNLIDLITASTMYRGNTRVITTVQQMIEELLTLRR